MMTSKRARESDAHFNSDEIRKIVMEIACAAGTPKDKEKIFRKKHYDFAERLPALFDMACQPNFDMQKLMYMLQMRDQILNNQTTLEDASKDVGQTLFNEYVAPVLPHAKTKDDASK